MMRAEMVALPFRVASATLAFGALAASAAPAATLRTAHRCYEQGAPVEVAARGFAAHAPLTVTLDGRVLRYGDGSLPSTSAAGAFTSSFYAPYLKTPTQRQRRIAVSAADGASTARAHFTITRKPGADFTPSQGNPTLLKVRFLVWGFALASGRNARTYLHWIDPQRRARASVALGRTRGACGVLTSTRRRIFPFVAQTGRWVLVIDTHRRYRRHARGPRAKIPVTVRPISL
jgi:hypothetical protein